MEERETPPSLKVFRNFGKGIYYRMLKHSVAVHLSLIEILISKITDLMSSHDVITNKAVSSCRVSYGLSSLPKFILLRGYTMKILARLGINLRAHPRVNTNIVCY